MYRILGVRDMGSNFYPFTAARQGNKLVTKGLFSKLSEVSTLLFYSVVMLLCCVKTAASTCAVSEMLLDLL